MKQYTTVTELDHILRAIWDDVYGTEYPFESDTWLVRGGFLPKDWERK